MHRKQQMTANGVRALRMLIVEDSPSEVRLAREALKEAGVPVDLTVAKDGIEAMQFLRMVEEGGAPRPDMILLDLNLPRKNGREVLGEVKASRNLKQIPVLVMTNSRSEDDIQAAYALNANCYIAKPADLDEYIEVIRAIERFWFFTATLPDERSSPGHGGHTLAAERYGLASASDARRAVSRAAS